MSSTVRRVDRFWQALRSDPAMLTAAWTLPRMASHCGLRATQFTQHTRRLTKLTPARYLMRCRLERGVQLLLEQPAQSVQAIALACGLVSGQHFANAFRRHFGCAPQIYRVTQLQGGDSAKRP